MPGVNKFPYHVLGTGSLGVNHVCWFRESKSIGRERSEKLCMLREMLTVEREPQREDVVGYGVTCLAGSSWSVSPVAVLCVSSVFFVWNLRSVFELQGRSVG